MKLSPFLAKVYPGELPIISKRNYPLFLVDIPTSGKTSPYFWWNHALNSVEPLFLENRWNYPNSGITSPYSNSWKAIPGSDANHILIPASRCPNSPYFWWSCLGNWRKNTLWFWLNSAYGEEVKVSQFWWEQPPTFLIKLPHGFWSSTFCFW